MAGQTDTLLLTHYYCHTVILSLLEIIAPSLNGLPYPKLFIFSLKLKEGLGPWLFGKAFMYVHTYIS